MLEKKRSSSTLLFLLFPFCLSASVSIDVVYVGDSGNPNDSTGYGRVDYGYYVGTYEVTNAQYAEFLRATAVTDTHGLYNTGMSGTYGGIEREGSSGSYTYSAIEGREDKPVNFVSFWDAARFANWLTNGQPSSAQTDGVTEDGMYDLNGVTYPTSNTITRDAVAWANGGVAIASESEWYKAAYYSGSPTGADGDGYWFYQIQSNSITTADANFGNVVGDTSDVGSYPEDPSYYGTFDQGGNVWEWNDQIVGDNRVLRGGAWGSTLDQVYNLKSSPRLDVDPNQERNNWGFRISRRILREPSAPVLELKTLYESPEGISALVDAEPASGYPTNFIYQWYKNDLPIAEITGGTNSIYRIDGIPENEGTWRVEVTNTEGTDTAEFEYRIFVDSDGDSLSDYREINITNTNPNVADTDADGLNDFHEVNITATDPNDNDSDKDTILDGIEVDLAGYGFDPAVDSSDLLSKYQEAAADLPGFLTDAQVESLRQGGTSLSPGVGGDFSIEIIIEESEDLIDWTIVDNINHTREGTGMKKFMRIRKPLD